ncbi:MAG: 16S rRNA (cytosine(1402)-N(4))-methyltransferase RsmH [Clostridia bacterium]|nr:16S rRNA (cytosine(1402)-N(4))-methyltransferase RsmH [Clostridia bacterium]
MEENKVMENTPTENGEVKPHKRRERYKGTHPRRFQDKYKELNPEKYKDDVEKIKNKGKTPAGMHIPIMVDEILDVLKIKPGEIGYDATLGYGGHTSKMLEKLEGKGHLYATDIDSIEIEKTKKRLAEKGFGDDILTVYKTNFCNIDTITPEEKFDFVLADLGVSSMQIDNPERGFTFKADGPLDLRLDPNSGTTAAQRLKELSKDEIVGMLIENSDEPYAEQIAREIIHTLRIRQPIETTKQLAAVIEKALNFLPAKTRKEDIKKSCQRTFQALRIDVNSEFEVLYEFLDKLPNSVKSGGRIAILTFHSGEDRLVKKAFKAMKREGIFSEISDEVIRPSKEECFRNSRAHSTKLRWAIRA